MFNIITQWFSTNLFNELTRHINDGTLEWEMMTLCDLRRKIEEYYWEWFFSNKEILNCIKYTWWIFTTRCENETWDICYIEWDNIKIYLEKLKNSKNINWIIEI